ncbi:transmembrane protein 272 isoform X3 [Sapajus apella]|uniref:Transmembrane protein 272 isoform X3 n=1 Tax=Sapajus apella TaxID=9515 RepID=A0A6J3J6E6_SAPAP|nr:transmembrane protein 272 isoform X3 [Sapajus apella]
MVSLLLYDSTRMRRLLSKAVVIDDDDDDEYPWRQNAHRYYIHLLLSLFLFLWFILGNYWVFSVYLPDFLPSFQQPQDYCDKTLYVFAVGVLALSHTVLVLLVLCSGCVYLCSRWRPAADED